MSLPPPPYPTPGLPGAAEAGAPAGVGELPAGVGELPADVGELPADVGEPPADVGEPLPDGVLELLPDGVLVLDAEGRVLAATGRAHRLLRRTTLVGARLPEAAPLLDDAGRDWWAGTARLRALPAVRRLAECEVYLDGGQALYLTASLTRRGGRVERVLVCLRAADARQRAERGRAELVSTVAHELRSPLTSVKGFTATLLAKWERFSDEQKKVMLATVNSDADRVTRLLSELLDVSRIDTGRLELRRQVVDLGAAVRRAVEGRVASGEAAERFELDLDAAVPELWLDPDKVDQVIGNLVENALRHGAGTVRLAVRPRAEGVLLTVADEGEGVPAELRRQVFTKFFRGRARRGGTGLGLYIVRGLVEAHGGWVSVGEVPAGGALFTVYLPAGAPPYPQ